MSKECPVYLKEALKKIMPGDQVEEILKYLDTTAKTRQIKYNEKAAKAYNMGVEEFIKKIEIERKKAKKLHIAASIVRAKAHKQIAEFKNISRGTWAYIGGIEGNVKKGRMSIAGNEFARKHYFLENLYANLLKGGQKLKMAFEHRHNDIDLGLELGDVDTKNQVAKDLAKAVKDTNKLILKEFKRLGIDIKDAEDYLAKLVHDPSKMISATGAILGDMKLRMKLRLEFRDPKLVEEEFRKVAFKRWHDFIRPETDLDKTFENVLPGNEEKFFQSFYDSVTTKIRKSPLADKGSPFSTSNANIANSLMQMRKWFPKDAHSWIKYNESFGAGNVHDAILNQFIKSGKLLGIMEKAGSNPGDFIARLLKRAEKKGRLDYKGAKYRKNAKWVAGEMLGEYSKPMQGLAGSIFRGFYQLQLLRLNMLGFTSIPDLNIMASALRPYGVTYLAAVKESIQNLIGGLPKDKRRDLLLEMGLFADGNMGGTLARFGNVDTPHGLFSKALMWQDVFSGINRLDNTGKATMGLMISNRVARFLSTSYQDLPKSFSKILDVYGLDEAWDMLTKNTNKLQNAGGRKFITPSIVEELSDDDIIKSMLVGEKRISPKKIEMARDDLYGRMLNFFSDQSNYGKVFPNSSDRALLRMGVHTDTFPGQMWASMTQFMTFGMASTRRTLGRFLKGGDVPAENLYQALFVAETRGDINGLIHYMVGSLPFGYMSLAAYALAAGKTLPDLTDPSTWLQVILRGDTLFYYTSILAYTARENKQGVARQLIGRPANTMIDLFELLKSIAIRKKVAKSALNFFQYDMPIPKFIFTKAAVDRLFFDALHEKVDPGYKARLRSKARERGERYWWTP